MFDVGLNEHNFIIAGSIDNQEYLILTEKVDNFNFLIKQNGKELTSIEDAKSLINEFIQMTRPMYKRYEIIGSFKEIKHKLDNKKINEVERLVNMSYLKHNNSGFIGEVSLLVGRDLVLQKVSVSRDRVVLLEEVKRIENIIGIQNPHE